MLSYILNRLLTAIGYKQDWHFTWTATIKGRELTYGDGTYTISPRLTSESIKEIRKILADETSKFAEAEVSSKDINILNITRIGR